VAARPAGRDQSQKSTTRSSGWESREHSLDQERGWDDCQFWRSAQTPTYSGAPGGSGRRRGTDGFGTDGSPAVKRAVAVVDSLRWFLCHKYTWARDITSIVFVLHIAVEAIVT